MPTKPTNPYVQATLPGLEDPTIKAEDERMLVDFIATELFPNKTPAVVSGDTPFKIEIVKESQPVNTGTPLGLVGSGWGAVRHPGQIRFFAGTFREPGEQCHVYRSLVIDTHYKQFETGKLYTISDVDDWGRITFKEDSGGLHVAVSESRILLNPGV